MTHNDIHDYYDSLAPDYDRDRFGNSYGRYVDAAEQAVLRAWLAQTPASDVVDLGCGTGRLLGFAMTGVDGSAAMLAVAKAKHPDRHLIQSTLPAINLPDAAFAAATCFHVLMHLDEDTITQSLTQIARVIRPGGRLILDIPSRHRRGHRRPSGAGHWHGATSATRRDIERWGTGLWRVRQRRAIVFLPIHRLSDAARRRLGGLDALICATPLGRYASYHVYDLERLA